MLYPGYLTKGFKPFDPIETTFDGKKIFCKDDLRKYTEFYCTGVYGGISTGYTVGCNLRCIFCWVRLSRDFPKKYGEYFDPEEVAKKLIRNAQIKKLSKVRISGGEPTISKEHLLGVLKEIKNTDLLFILETNGILFGYDESYVKKLKEFKNIHIRVSIKSGSPEGFQRRTGAIGDFYRVPFNAISNLMKNQISFHVACMSDPRLMPQEERNFIISKLNSIGYTDFIEEEICDPYDTTVMRLEKAGYKIFFR
jgi:uncharacterized Fe-S cluster-containing radical SAM superfamily protein